MKYLESFLKEKGTLKRDLPLTDKIDKIPSVGFDSDPKARLSTSFSPSGAPDAEPLARPVLPASDRAIWTRTITPNNRHPLIPPEVRAKVEAIEAQARAKAVLRTKRDILKFRRHAA